MFDFPVVYVDIETTGGSYRSSRVLEVAAIRVEHGQVVDEFSTILDPETYVPSYITTITGIQPSDTHGKPKFAEIADRFAEICEGAVFIAHNVRFDYVFLKQEFSLVGKTFSPRLLCTVRLSRALYATEKGHSLAKLIERHEIPVRARHRALEDARALSFFTQLAFKEHGSELFAAAVAKQLKGTALPPKVESSQIEAIRDTPGVYIFRDSDGAPLYVGKSVSLKKRVLSHFQSTALREVKMGQQVTDIQTIETGTELAALLLESKLIKQLQPIHNRLLRRTTQYAVLVHDMVDGYATLTVSLSVVQDVFGRKPIYGIFKNRTAAKKKLEEYVTTFSLCAKLVGLEKTKAACFRYSLGSCKGACIGKEPAELYNRRLELALLHSKIPEWEHQTPISVPISEEGERLVIDRWMIQGTLSSEGEWIYDDTVASFDVDEYKIIRRYLRAHPETIQPVPALPPFTDML